MNNMDIFKAFRYVCKIENISKIASLNLIKDIKKVNPYLYLPLSPARRTSLPLSSLSHSFGCPAVC